MSSQNHIQPINKAQMMNSFKHKGKPLKLQLTCFKSKSLKMVVNYSKSGMQNESVMNIQGSFYL